jgi:hypothetical protein
MHASAAACWHPKLVRLGECVRVRACRYKLSFQRYIKEMVLPALQDLHEDTLLRELVRRWDNHKVSQTGAWVWACAHE